MKSFAITLMVTLGSIAATVTGYTFAVISLLTFSASDEELLIQAIDAEQTYVKPVGNIVQALSVQRLISQSNCPVSEHKLHPAITSALSGVVFSDSPNNEVQIEKVISIFLQDGCEIDEYNYLGHTALHTAILFKSSRLVSFLLANGANPNAKIMMTEARNKNFSEEAGMNAMEWAIFLKNRASGYEHDQLSFIIESLKQRSEKT